MSNLKFQTPNSSRSETILKRFRSTSLPPEGHIHRQTHRLEHNAFLVCQKTLSIKFYSRPHTPVPLYEQKMCHLQKSVQSFRGKIKKYLSYQYHMDFDVKK